MYWGVVVVAEFLEFAISRRRFIRLEEPPTINCIFHCGRKKKYQKNKVEKEKLVLDEEMVVLVGPP